MAKYSVCDVYGGWGGGLSLEDFMLPWLKPLIRRI